MAQHILYCYSCKKYTMKLKCPICGATTAENKPAKFSLDDKYGAYRRTAKKENLEKQGLI